MRDDEGMDALLRKTLEGDFPSLPAGFDARVMYAVRPRRLSLRGKLVMGVYATGAVLTAAWLMRDLPFLAIGAGLVISATVAAAASAYGNRLAPGD